MSGCTRRWRESQVTLMLARCCTLPPLRRVHHTEGRHPSNNTKAQCVWEQHTPAEPTSTTHNPRPTDRTGNDGKEPTE